MVRIDLTKWEVRQILLDKYGKADFRVFYTESDKLWEARNNKKLEDLLEAPQKESYILWFDEE